MVADRNTLGFSRFVGLDERDAPDLLVRMSSGDLPVDGSRYGVRSRLIAAPGVSVADLAFAVTGKFLQEQKRRPEQIDALVVSSRIPDPAEAARQVVRRLGCGWKALGIERACSGFPAAVSLAREFAAERRAAVLVVTAEILSPHINWEAADGNLADHRRARGQAARLFGDGAAAVLVAPPEHGGLHPILDAWHDTVDDPEALIQKTEVVDSVDPWGRVRTGPTDCMSMPGRRGLLLVRRAPRILADAVLRSTANRAGETHADEQELPDWVVPHQANALITQRLRALAETELGGARVLDAISSRGNTVSASIPLAVVEAQDDIAAGSLVAMPSVGAGGPGYRPDVLSTGCVLAVWHGSRPGKRPPERT